MVFMHMCEYVVRDIYVKTWTLSFLLEKLEEHKKIKILESVKICFEQKLFP